MEFKEIREKDYWHLNPFPDEDKTSEIILSSAGVLYVAYVLQNLSDDPKTLKEAKETDEWPEWEKAINIELNQLNQMNTWELVDPPDHAIAIANK